ncbi:MULTISPECIES: Flp pilus assembly protein CpaB [unclassified Pseudomonas]|uniref:Flp pilus assembly protein CpaB n=1 Tax=unclassified Pseudomonas TaxID=196821 RepID=UPI00244AC991|nr:MULTISPECIES: Flp pilus assembly protein CpaB [unclassified Pseudomonas]MDG9924867.1 Flp pilus assembly protein CpaB [Pseudomonas sp. GD04045]MDH0036148.1 Flp pilus assembly protein CpaB [Pseudomonas sp. GD04019]
MQPVSGSKLLIIAVVCGVLAGGAAWMYLKSKEAQYREAYKPPVERKVTLIVPRQDMGKAEVIRKEKVAALDVPAQFVPSGAVLAQDWKKLDGRMVEAPLQKGKPITWSAVEGSSVSRFSENVELGKRGKTVKISKINSFDGLLRPGDHVDLLGTFSATDIGLQKQPNYADDVIMTVLENVVVLAAGREDASGRKYETFFDRNSADGFNMNFSTVTLQLTPQQVARVELAEKSGELVAVLRHPKDTSFAKLGQVTVANLLDPPPAETADVVLGADGQLVGRIVGDNVVDAQGRIVGKMVDGKAVSFDGKTLGTVAKNVAANDPLLRMRERADVVRDADGNVVGRIKDGKVLDADGKVIGVVKNGQAVGLKGETLGRVERNAALDAQGRVIDMSKSTAQASPQKRGSEQQIVRDATGKVIGRVVDGKVVDANGQVIGVVKDGKPVGLEGKVLGQVSTAVVDAQGKVVGQIGEVVRDANGKIIGRVIDGQVVDGNGKVIGKIKDGKALTADGKALGQVDKVMLDEQGRPKDDGVRVARDASGKVLGTVVGDRVLDEQGREVGKLVDGKVIGKDGQVLADAVDIEVQQDAVRVARDASGKAIGTVKGDTVYDASGKVVGKLVDGKVVDANGNVLASGISAAVEGQAQADTALAVAGEAQEGAAPQASRMVQFIPGGTGKDGIIPIQTIRME